MADESCRYCGVRTVRWMLPGHHKRPNQRTADHVQPKSRGGSHLAHNRVVACRECNKLKADMTGEEFEYFLATGCLAESYVKYVESKNRKITIPTSGRPRHTGLIS